MASEELRERLAALSTHELVDIVRNRNAEEWRSEVFPLVAAILQERGVDAAAIPHDEPETLEFEALESVASLRDPFQASLWRMALQEAGIEAWLSIEHLAGVVPPVAIAIGIDVLVRAESVSAAREVLAALESGAASIPPEPE